MIAEDLEHSRNEKRYYSFGENREPGYLPSGSLIDPAAFVSSVPDIGERVRKSMNKRIRYSEETIGDSKLVSDFLPSPEELVLKQEQIKVTLALSAESVAFFKEAAKRHHTPYQKMIRQLLDAYVSLHKRTK